MKLASRYFRTVQMKRKLKGSLSAGHLAKAARHTKFCTPDVFLYEYDEALMGTLVRRYKRFLGDICLEGLAPESIDTIHVPNTGPMVGLLGALPAPAFLSKSKNAARKYALTLEWIRVIEDSQGNGPWVGVHSAKANAMVRALLEAHLVPGLPTYENIQAEVYYGEKSRLDFFLSGGEAAAGVYVEVKSVTMAENMREVQ